MCINCQTDGNKIDRSKSGPVERRVFKIPVGKLTEEEAVKAKQKLAEILKSYETQEWKNVEFPQNESQSCQMDVFLPLGATKQDATAREQQNMPSDGVLSTSEVWVCKAGRTPSPQKTRASKLFHWVKSKFMWKSS